MKLLNKKTNIAYNTRTQKEGNRFISIVERWEVDAHGIPLRAMLSSRETHPTRGKAQHYARSMARYQFRAHCAVHGM